MAWKDFMESLALQVHAWWSHDSGCWPHRQQVAESLRPAASLSSMGQEAAVAMARTAPALMGSPLFRRRLYRLMEGRHPITGGYLGAPRSMGDPASAMTIVMGTQERCTDNV